LKEREKHKRVVEMMARQTTSEKVQGRIQIPKSNLL